MNCHYISDFWIFTGAFMLGAIFFAVIFVLNLWRLAYQKEQDREYKERLKNNRYQEIQS